MPAIPSDVEFGALPRTATCYGDGTFPTYEEKRWPLLPRSKWEPVSMNRHVRIIYRQLDGHCTSNGACETVMIDRSSRGRHDNPILSPEHLYRQHSRDGTGSTLDENLQALVDYGVCTRELIPQDMSVRDYPSGNVLLANARKNRMLEWIDLNADFDAVATALQRRQPCLIGVNWPGGGGHAVAATQLIRDGRGWALRIVNSWGEDRGEKPGYTQEDLEWLKAMGRRPLTGGFDTLTERECRDFGTFGCWAAGSST